MKQNEKIEMPREPLSSVYADAKTSLTKAVRNVMQAFPLPVFMFESLLDGLLCDIQAEAKMELSSDMQVYKGDLENKIREMQEAHEKEKEELIRQFEEPPETKEKDNIDDE